MSNKLPPLKAEEIKAFIAEGYVVIPPSPSQNGDLHRSVFKKAELLGARTEELGNNILPAVRNNNRRFTVRERYFFGNNNKPN